MTVEIADATAEFWQNWITSNRDVFSALELDVIPSALERDCSSRQRANKCRGVDYFFLRFRVISNAQQVTEELGG